MPELTEKARRRAAVDAMRIIADALQLDAAEREAAYLVALGACEALVEPRLVADLPAIAKAAAAAPNRREVLRTLVRRALERPYEPCGDENPSHVAPPSPASLPASAAPTPSLTTLFTPSAN